MRKVESVAKVILESECGVISESECSDILSNPVDSDPLILSCVTANIFSRLRVHHS